MVGHAEHLLRTEAFQSSGPQSVKCLRGGHLMTVQTVYIQLCRTVVNYLHDVLVPYLIK